MGRWVWGGTGVMWLSMREQHVGGRRSLCDKYVKYGRCEARRGAPCACAWIQALAVQNVCQVWEVWEFEEALSMLVWAQAWRTLYAWAHACVWGIVGLHTLGSHVHSANTSTPPLTHPHLRGQTPRRRGARAEAAQSPDGGLPCHCRCCCSHCRGQRQRRRLTSCCLHAGALGTLAARCEPASPPLSTCCKRVAAQVWANWRLLQTCSSTGVGKLAPAPAPAPARPAVEMSGTRRRRTTPGSALKAAVLYGTTFIHKVHRHPYKCGNAKKCTDFLQQCGMLARHFEYQHLRGWLRRRTNAAVVGATAAVTAAAGAGAVRWHAETPSAAARRARRWARGRMGARRRMGRRVRRMAARACMRMCAASGVRPHTAANGGDAQAATAA
eukprot:365977-Chlamydomonas_euryale.AAC.5